ncbi:MAG TPA: hypothetical protein PLP01_13770 [Phycisphaerae bacterium]|nr:hypothetical protein [Phycisphaerae bacterium]
MEVAHIFEAVMLFCFGFSWPVAIRKTLRVRMVHGKSVGFLYLVVVGYLAGIVMKFLRADGGLPDWVTLLYATNAVMVSIEIVLYYRFRRAPTEPGLDLVPESPGTDVEPPEHCR